MELNMITLVTTIVALSLATYIFLFGFVKKANEWYYCSFSRTKDEKKNSKPLPPGDMGWPLFGNMKAFLKAFNSNNPEAFLDNIVQRHGRIGVYKTHLFGMPTALVTLPETCKAVLSDDASFKLGYPSSEKLAGKKSLINLQGNEHKRLRKLTTGPINGSEALASYTVIIEDVVMAKLDEWASLEKPLVLLNELKGFTFQIITNIFFGSKGYFMFGSMRGLFTILTDALFTMGIDYPGSAYRKGLKARKELVTIVNIAIEDRRAMHKANKVEEKKSMLDFLLEVKNEDGENLDNETIIDLLAGIMFAGHESTAFATMWMLLFLHDYPNVLEKVKAEQEEVLKKRPSEQKGLNSKEIRSMDYTTKVIQEALRIANLSFASFRETKVDVEINGYTIPRGWKVLVMNRGVHMDPLNYSNPKVFDPSRWDNLNVKAGGFIPFGLGPRVCPGNDLAKFELYIFVHCFVLNYKFERVNPNCELAYFPVPRPIDNCFAKITKNA